VDADTILLRDMRPLANLGREWTYEWGCTGLFNTAVIYIPKNSVVAKKVLRLGFINNGSFHPWDVSKYIKDDIWMFPVSSHLLRKTSFDDFQSCWFDPLWPFMDGCDKTWPTTSPPDDGKFSSFSVFTKDLPYPKRHQDFFSGAWTYHYHCMSTFSFSKVRLFPNSIRGDERSCHSREIFVDDLSI